MTGSFRRNGESGRGAACLGLALVTAGVLAGPWARAQTGITEAPAAPQVSVSRVNSGMSSGLPQDMSEQQIQMMQVRAAAQGARGDAAAASMARSADQAMEDRHLEATLQEAREIKRIKRDARNRMKWREAQNAYERVSANEMESWRTDSGNIRVERNVPNEFLVALREEEAAIAAREGAPDEEGFSPLKSTGRLLTSPFGGGRKREADYAEPAQGGGIMSNIGMPRLPFTGGGRRATPNPYEQPQSAPAPAADPSSPAQPQTIPVSTAPTRPGTVPQISGAALVDGAASVNNVPVGGSSPPASQNSVGNRPPAGEPAFAVPSAQPEKKGFFAKLSPFGGGGGKKKKRDDVGGIDASLFPEGSVSTTSTTPMAPSPYEAPSPSQGASAGGTVASRDSSGLSLPGAEPEKERGGFSLPKPQLKVPKIGGDGGGGAPAQATSVINGNGNAFYRVASSAQFMQYGASTMESEIRALSAGTLVRMTKPGAEWATIQLQDGSQGVIQVSNLRPASSGEVPAQFGVAPATP